MYNLPFLEQANWIRRQMPVTQNSIRALPSLDGIKLACSMHLEIKMLPLIEGLLEKGAQLFLTTCNPNTVRDDFVSHVQSLGAKAIAQKGMSEEEQMQSFKEALKWSPTHLCEMGADLTRLVHQENASLNHPNSPIQASLEATGSGLTRLEGLDLKYPIFNWNNVPIKENLHNRRMVGLMTWNAFLNRTGLTLHGKQIAVIGYGPVGEGVANAAVAFGGAVTVVEKNSERAFEARCDGWTVVEMDRALRESDVIVTVTGAQSVLTRGDFFKMKDGVFLLNSGHLNQEIDVLSLKNEFHSTPILPFVDEFRVEDRRIYLFADGSMANLVAGHGDSLNSFDQIEAILVRGIHFMLKNSTGDNNSDKNKNTNCNRYKPGVYLLPRDAGVP